MTWPWVSRHRLELAERLLSEAVRDRKVAEDRLYAAWQTGALQVPPRGSVLPPEKKVVQILPDKLREYVENWEDPVTRMEVEAEARRLHYDLGQPEERVLDLFKQRSPEPEPVL